MIQPRAGVAVLQDHIELMLHLQMQVLIFFLQQLILIQDKIDIKKRENGINESRTIGRSFLNGFPAVNYGVEGCMKVYGAVGVPLQIVMEHRILDYLLKLFMQLDGHQTKVAQSVIMFLMLKQFQLKIQSSIGNVRPFSWFL